MLVVALGAYIEKQSETPLFKTVVSIIVNIREMQRGEGGD